MGQVLQAGVGQIPARQAAVAGGIAMDVPAVTINKVCLSGLDAIALADQLIRAGEFDVVVAGGMESMTRAPHLLPGSRAGFKYGDTTLVDHLSHDGLHDVFTDVPMGQLTETTNDLDPISRLDQDTFAARSHQLRRRGHRSRDLQGGDRAGRRARAAAATSSSIPTRASAPDTTVESLGKLRPAFRKDGTITAGTSSQISDGAAAVVVMSKDEAERRGLDWIAEITAHGMIAGPDSTLQDKPARAIRAACAKAGIEPADLDLVEINEAFAAVGIASTRSLGIDEDIVNVNGGAIALGHPIGMSGARIVLHLALELQRRGGGTGVATLCGGGGQGDALLITVPAGALIGHRLGGAGGTPAGTAGLHITCSSDAKAAGTNSSPPLLVAKCLLGQAVSQGVQVDPAAG